MAYPIIKSVWDNFTTAYQNAREARAREERAKELSMREFDANQRSWNEDDRVGDEYTNYISPAKQYALRGFGWADELRAAAQGGNVAMAKMNSGAKTQFATPENQALITQSATDKLKQIAFENAAFNKLLTPQQRALAVTAPYTQRALIGAQTNEDFKNWFDPEQSAWRNQNTKDSITLGRMNNKRYIDEANSQLTEMQNAENKSTTEKETARLLSRYPAPTIAAQTPMSAMAAKQPTTTEAVRPLTAGESFDAARLNRRAIEQRLALVGLAERTKNPSLYQTLLDSLNQAKINEAIAQDAWMKSPEAIALQKAYIR